MKHFKKARYFFWHVVMPNYRIMRTKLNPISATKSLYKQRIGHYPDLDNPKTMTEKMQWLKLNCYCHSSLVTKCADKYRVREYLREKGCEDILNPLYGVWDDVDEIDWETLPDSFVLKCNHGCGYNIICPQKSELDIENTKKILRKWMHEKYGQISAEMIYDDINPKIVCEKYIESSNGMPISDYKIFCSYGEPKFIYLISGGHGEGECLDYYSVDWEWIPVKNGIIPNAKKRAQKPEKLEEMLAYAKILSADFPMVRVDLYCESNAIIFGELTFLATGGMTVFNPPKYDREFGDLFNIDALVKKQKSK